jgi:hypothetical protein
MHGWGEFSFDWKARALEKNIASTSRFLEQINMDPSNGHACIAVYAMGPVYCNLFSTYPQARRAVVIRGVVQFWTHVLPFFGKSFFGARDFQC